MKYVLGLILSCAAFAQTPCVVMLAQSAGGNAPQFTCGQLQQGAPGPQGPAGPQGIPGQIGPVGPAGPPGASGVANLTPIACAPSAAPGQIAFYAADPTGRICYFQVVAVLPPNIVGGLVTTGGLQIAGVPSVDQSTIAASPLRFSVQRTSPTTLVVGSECTALVPCQAVFNTVPIGFPAPSTITYQSGVGNLRVYLGMTPQGTGYIGVAPDNAALLVACDCVVNQPPSPNPPVTSFPIGSIPLAGWTVTTAGQFDATGLDLRSPLRSSFTQLGTGLATIQPPGNVGPNLMVDQTSVPMLSPIPATMADMCAPPQFALDPVNHLRYDCVAAAPPLWLRSTLSTWP